MQSVTKASHASHSNCGKISKNQQGDIAVCEAGATGGYLNFSQLTLFIVDLCFEVSSVTHRQMSTVGGLATPFWGVLRLPGFVFRQLVTAAPSCACCDSLPDIGRAVHLRVF